MSAVNLSTGYAASPAELKTQASENAFPLCGTVFWYHKIMKRAHQKVLEAVFAHPTSGNIAWSGIEALLVGLGAEVSEREGSRVAIVLFNEVRVFHRPHPSPKTDKGAVVSVKKWLEQHGVKPWA